MITVKDRFITFYDYMFKHLTNKSKVKKTEHAVNTPRNVKGPLTINTEYYS